LRRIARSSSRLALATLAAACVRGGAVGPAPPRPPDAAGEIRALLIASAAAWNRGDLDGFLHPYLDSDSTTFIGSTGLIRGLARVRERYRYVYWKGGAPATRLDFEDITITLLGPEHALAVGYYVLRNRGSPDVADRGIFSLVFTLTRQGWRIINDHTSSLTRR
jgi:ketosteroid isomerase-like protein